MDNYIPYRIPRRLKLVMVMFYLSFIISFVEDIQK